jgi:pimeloyl-ACP methyl ester carboxylesterase
MTLTAEDQLEHLRLAARLSGLHGVEVVLPREHDTVLGGIRLHHVDWGCEGRPPVVFLHGGGLTARTWDLVCLALRSEFHCLALDQRGHGDSEWSPALDYRVDAFVADIAALIDHLGLRRPVLVGQSMGGLNALALAALHPGRLGGLVAVDVAPDVEPAGAERILDFVMEPAELDSVDAFVERAIAFNPARDPRLLRRSLLHNLRELADGGWTWKYDRRLMTRERFVAVRGELKKLRGRLARITCPVLVVRGARSDVVTPEGAAVLARALPSGSCSEVPDAGHTVQGDNPYGLAKALRGFFEDIRF